jgi:AAA domain/Bifunctional DNA primase/polymerase, N-terminal
MSETTAQDVLFAALEFRAAGISVVPVREDGSKAPARNWKEFQERLAEPAEILASLSNAQGFGIVTGAISGQLEMLELEGRAINAGCLQDAREIAYASGLEYVWEILSSTYVEQTPSGGVHWLYRISDAQVPGNTKLARRPGENGGVDVLAETRGEGGFVIVAPSHGDVHSSGAAWLRLNDSTPSSIKTLTMDQRDALHDIFRALDQMPDAEIVAQTVSAIRESDGSLPGDDYNLRATWDEILTGWSKVYQRGSETYWRRPGKSEGISASTGRNDSDNLYIWTTSTTFEAEKPYSKFAAFAHLNFGGDYSAAARDLKRLGYGQTTPALTTYENTLRPLRDVIGDGSTTVELHLVDGIYTPENDPEFARRQQLFAYELESQSIRRDVKKHLDDEQILANFRTPTVVRSAAEELAMPDEETPWTVFELFPRGANVLLTAAYKSGKTTMVNNLVKSLVDNEPFLGRYGIEPHDGRVVIFNYEVDPRQYRQWLRDMKVKNLDKITMVHLRGLRMPLTTEHVEDEIVKMLASYECQTWILDPFARAFVGSGEENSNSDVGRFLDTLDVIKARAGVTNLVMPAHTGRAEEQGITRARGATRLDDHADARWILTKSATGERFFSASGRDVEVEEHLLGFDPETRHLSVEKATTRAAKGRLDLEDRIVEYVRDHPRCNAGQLYKGVGGNENEFRIARDSAIASGRLHRDETGVSKLFYVAELRPLSSVTSGVS